MLANDRPEYAVYFPTGGSVSVDITGRHDVRWYDIDGGTWEAETSDDGPIDLETPGEGQWCAVVR